MNRPYFWKALIYNNFSVTTPTTTTTTTTTTTKTATDCSGMY